MSELAETVRKLIERGFAPIPVPHRSKEPVLPNWQNLRLTAQSVSHYFNGTPSNVGLLLTAGLTDVDLDCAEAAKAGELLLPTTTWVTGRKSAPASHRWFQCPNRQPAYLKFEDPLGGTGDHGAVILELRSGNRQSLIPPSTHPSGEDVVAFGDLFASPASIDGEVLSQAVKKTAAAALLARHWPGVGRRHDAALALAGGLKRARWTKEEATRFVQAVATASGDEQTRNRLRDVTSTFGKDGKIRGWPALCRLIDRRVVNRVREWLGLQSAAQRRVRELAPFQSFPVEALPIPLGDYVHQSAQALGVDPSFVALPVLSVVASCIGNTRTIQLKRTWQEQCVLWSLIIGDSGGLKTPAFIRAVGPLQRAQKTLIDQYRLAFDNHVEALEQWKANRRKSDDEQEGRPEAPILRRMISSDCTIERLAQTLEDNPRGILFGRDELAAWLGGFRRYKGRDGGSDLQNWLEMSRAGTINYERKTGERNLVYVQRAAVSICGGIQPGTLARAMRDGEYLECGLAARLLMAMPPKPTKRWSEMEVAELTEEAYETLITKLQALSFEKRDGEDVPYVLRLDPAAKSVWVEFYDAWGREQAAAEGEIAAALSKLEGAAARFALVHHVVSHVWVDTDDRRPVGLKSVEAGIVLAKWFADEARRIYATFGESETDRQARRLVEFIRARGGRITVRELQKSNSRKYADSEQAREALDGLVQMDLGYWTEPEVGPKGGQPAVWFVLDTDGTTDSTDTTPDDDDDSDGQGARQSPRSPDSTPCGAQEKPGSVGSVGSAGDNPESNTQDTWAVDTNVSEPEEHRVVSDVAYSVIRRYDDLQMVLSAVEESVTVALDLETTGLNPRSDRVRLLSVAVDTVDGGTFSYLVDCFQIDPKPLLNALAGKDLVIHNAQFDLSFLDRIGFTPTARVHDTMLIASVLEVGTKERVSLAACSQRYLGRALDKAEQRSDWSGNLSADQLAYAALDVDVLKPLWAALKSRIAEAKLEHAAAIECRCLPAIVWMSGRGVAFDQSTWEALAQTAADECVKTRAELDSTAPTPPGSMFEGWNWDSPKQVQEALAAVGCPVDGTSDWILSRVDHPLGELLRRYREVSKQATTYGLDWLKHVASDGRVYPLWRQFGAWSGRMSCSVPNMQQMPRGDYRRCVIAPPGRVLIKADYSQIELRLAAKIAKETVMIEAYRRGDDLHTLTAKQLLGKVDVTKSDRQLAKALNFGLLYGMGARGLRGYARTAYGVEMTEEQATAYRTKFFLTYPGLATWHRKTGCSGKMPVETRTISGRRLIGVKGFCEKLNTPVQGSGADGLKTALGLLWERRDQAPGTFPVMAVHDEIVVEADADRAEDAQAWLKAAMIDAMAPLADPVPVEVECSVGVTWAGD
jgi:DNA polymerase I-like protein with 3'-5' exonuclease and polymerase domains